MGLLILIVIAMVLVGTLPVWHHSRRWGYVPSMSLGVVLLIALVLVALGVVRFGQ